MQKQIDELRDRIRQAPTVSQSMRGFIAGIAGQIREAKDKPKDIEAIAAAMEGSATQLSEAMVMNTAANTEFPVPAGIPQPSAPAQPAEEEDKKADGRDAKAKADQAVKANQPVAPAPAAASVPGAPQSLAPPVDYIPPPVPHAEAARSSVPGEADTNVPAADRQAAEDEKRDVNEENAENNKKAAQKPRQAGKSRQRRASSAKPAEDKADKSAKGAKGDKPNQARSGKKPTRLGAQKPHEDGRPHGHAGRGGRKANGDK